MNVLVRLILIPVALLCGLLLGGCERTISTHRYRLTLEVDTPAGLKSGSSVIEAIISDAIVVGHPGGSGPARWSGRRCSSISAAAGR